MPMDLNTIDLTTMDEAKLGRILGVLGVTPPEMLRSSLYISYLIHAKVRLTANAEIIGKNGSCPSEKALKSANLTNELAEMLDFFLIPAINNDFTTYFNGGAHGDPNYRRYFLTRFFVNEFKENVQAFLDSYPPTKYALGALEENFVNNILQACVRVRDDKEAIQTVFNGQVAGLQLKELFKIIPTGSDFHKGGKQVLKLYFKTHNGPEFRLIYKPSDVEMDCRLVGKSNAINALIPNFMRASLIEIINDRIGGNLDLDLLSIPTYHILPRMYTSTSNAVPLPLREAYGYIEYLEHEYGDKGSNILNYYPGGKSDCLIFKTDRGKHYPELFYKLLGQWTAIACMFCILDLHVENIIVNKYKPILIDLEVSFSKVVKSVSDTSLIYSDLGGIDCLLGKNIILWDIEETELPPLEMKVTRKPQQNRLWSVPDSGPKTLVPVDWVNLKTGFGNAMDLLRRIVNADRLVPPENRTPLRVWFDELEHVLVRVVPYPTELFQEFINRIFAFEGEKRDLNTVISIAIKTYFESDGGAYRSEQEATKLPKFIIWQDAIIGDDIRNLDVPVFYNRIGSANILDSQGRPVIIPLGIDVPEVGYVNINRNTYYPGKPVTAIREKMNDLATEATFVALRDRFLDQLHP